MTSIKVDSNNIFEVFWLLWSYIKKGQQIQLDINLLQDESIDKFINLMEDLEKDLETKWKWPLEKRLSNREFLIDKKNIDDFLNELSRKGVKVYE